MFSSLPYLSHNIKRPFMVSFAVIPSCVPQCVNDVEHTSLQRQQLLTGVGGLGERSGDG